MTDDDSTTSDHSPNTEDVFKPEEPKMLCTVCKEVSDNHHVHYGAMCCFSCRAFFRRANQTMGKIYSCKVDGKCDVSRKNRKKCQKCRYEACLAAGMDPGLVLNEDQKKTRFRKSLEKKSEPLAGAGSESDELEGLFSERHLPSIENSKDLCSVSTTDKLRGVKRRRVTLPSQTLPTRGEIKRADQEEADTLVLSLSLEKEIEFRTSDLELLNPGNEHGGNYEKNPGFDLVNRPDKALRYNQKAKQNVLTSRYFSPKFLNEQLACVLNDFDQATVRLIQRDEEVFQTFYRYHCDYATLTQSDACKIVTCLADQMKFFAVSQSAFRNLSSTDQVRLLSYSRPLYVHYILGQYFSKASCGSVQLQWLLGEDRLTGLDSSHAVPRNILCLNDQVNFFATPDKALLYLTKATDLLKNVQASPSMNGLVASLILFSPQASLSYFEDPHLLQVYQTTLIKQIMESQFASLLGMENLQSNQDVLPPFIQALQQLKEIFMASDDIDQRTSSQPSPKNDLEMNFTIEEENFLTQQINLFKTSYNQVSLGDDFVKEYVMYTYDVPLSKNFAFRGYSTFAERFRRLLMLHPGFMDLTTKDQNSIWKQGCAKAAACISARSSCFTNGTDHLHFMFGVDDHIHWQENFAQSSAAGSRVATIKRIHMSDCNTFSCIYSSEELMDYLRLVGQICEVTKDELIFSMLVLLSLFSGDSLSPTATNFVSEIKNTYMRLLKRKLRHDRRTYSKICVSLADIDDLSKYLRKLDVQDSSLSTVSLNPNLKKVSLCQ